MLKVEKQTSSTQTVTLPNFYNTFINCSSQLFTYSNSNNLILNIPDFTISTLSENVQEKKWGVIFSLRLIHSILTREDADPTITKTIPDTCGLVLFHFFGILII